MDVNQVDFFLMNNGKNFPAERIYEIRNVLISSSPERAAMLMSMSYRDTLMTQLVSIFVGSLGIDRFLIDDVGMGVLKLLTGGCCGILMIYDWVTIVKQTRDYNYKLFISGLNYTV